MTTGVLIDCAICERPKPLAFAQPVEAVRGAFPSAIADGDRGWVCADCVEALIAQREKRGVTPPSLEGQ
jgi:hypothetical protein